MWVATCQVHTQRVREKGKERGRLEFRLIAMFDRFPLSSFSERKKSTRRSNRSGFQAGNKRENGERGGGIDLERAKKIEKRVTERPNPSKVCEFLAEGRVWVGGRRQCHRHHSPRARQKSRKASWA